MLSKAHWKQYPNPNFRQQIFTMSHQSRAQLFPFFPFFFSYIRINVRKSFHLPNWQPILYSLLTNANQTKLNTNVRQLHNFFLFLNCWCCCYSWTIWVCVCDVYLCAIHAFGLLYIQMNTCMLGRVAADLHVSTTFHQSFWCESATKLTHVRSTNQREFV